MCPGIHSKTIQLDQSAGEGRVALEPGVWSFCNPVLRHAHGETEHRSSTWPLVVQPGGSCLVLPLSCHLEFGPEGEQKLLRVGSLGDRKAKWKTS